MTDTAPGVLTAAGEGTLPKARSGPRAALRPTPTLLVAAAVLLAVVGWGLVPQLFTSHDPLVGVSSLALRPPSLQHWFGTDYLGRDLYARVVYGTRFTVLTATLAVVIGLAAGVALGVVAGVFGGALDTVVMRIVDALLSIPALLLSLCLLAAIGKGLVPIAIAVGVGSVAGFARLARVEVLTVLSFPFVEAARVTGSSRSRAIRRHVLPHIVRPITAVALLDVGASVLAIATLGFLGYGVTPPQPEWGLLISEGRNYIAGAWWLTTLPGLVVVALVLAIARIHRAFSHAAIEGGTL